MHHRLSLCLLLLCAAPLAAQHGPPKEGDLIPRSGTLMYMVSDRPDAAYRLFGTDAKGNWRLRGIAQTTLDKQSGDMDEEGAKAAQSALNFVFDSYESLARVEIGIVDITLDGPKYVIHMQLKPGRTINLQPDFLGSWLSRTVDYRDRKVLMYRLDAGAEPGEGEGEEGENGAEGMGPADANYFGMNRYYVTDLGGSVLLSNFESTIRESVDLFLDRDEGEALSGRAEFKEWSAQRKPHDLSTFVIGREVQNLIERLMPSKEQAGIDVQKIYADLDAWIQFREYRYIAVDVDYDDKARGITMQSTIKARRPTKILEKLAMPPKRFDGMKYVPSSAVLTAGAQMGEPQKSWDNIVEFMRDMQKSIKELEGMGTPWGGREPDWPEDDEEGPGMPPMPPQPEPEEDQRVPDDAHLPRNLGPLRMFGDVARALQEQPAEPATPAEPAEDDYVGQALKGIEDGLGKYGTSIKEILSVLGGETIVFADIDAKRMGAMPHGNPMEALGAASFGVVITLKDAKLAQAILERAREKDPEGVFKGLEIVEAAGAKIHVSAERNFGYVITGDALLICYADSQFEEGDRPAVVGSLAAMITAASKKTTADPFIGECSSFLLVDIGRVARMQMEMADEQARRLDRYVRPNRDQMVKQFEGMHFGVRSREFKDMVEYTMRLNGLPDFGLLLEQAVVGGGSADNQAWMYTEDNLRRVSEAMRNVANTDKDVTLEALVEAGLRKAALQTPFDARWQGDRGTLGWMTLDQLERDEDGKLPPWVDEAAAAMIDRNEKEGFRSFRLADGPIKQHLKEYKAGMIVLYQEKADCFGGHFVLYADGQVGWLHADAFKQALALNREGKPVPARDMLEDEEIEPDTPDGEEE